MRSRRWLTIGAVKADWYVRAGNCGYPGGLYLDWKCRVDWAAPWEFLEWRHVVRAVARRLSFSGLQLRAIACGLERRDGWITLRVEVERTFSRKAG